MSLEKAIKSGKEHRKPYRGSKAIDASCRNHGGCPYCEANRKHKFLDKEGKEMLDDFVMNQSYDELQQADDDFWNMVHELELAAYDDEFMNSVVDAWAELGNY